VRPSAKKAPLEGRGRSARPLGQTNITHLVRLHLCSKGSRGRLGPCSVRGRAGNICSPIRRRRPLSRGRIAAFRLRRLSTLSFDRLAACFGAPLHRVPRRLRGIVAGQRSRRKVTCSYSSTNRYAANSSSNAFASFRSRVSNPSVNHPNTGASSSRASLTLPWSRQRRARLTAARSSQDLACC
jgi:hypothetical protein